MSQNTQVGVRRFGIMIGTEPGKVVPDAEEVLVRSTLIKDRMERSGMRWTEQMAEAIVQLRAIDLSGDFDAYWQFHIEQDPRRLYPAWTVVPK